MILLIFTDGRFSLHPVKCTCKETSVSDPAVPYEKVRNVRRLAKGYISRILVSLSVLMIRRQTPVFLANKVSLG